MSNNDETATELFSHLTVTIITLILVCFGILTKYDIRTSIHVITNSDATISQSQQQPYEVKITSPVKNQITSRENSVWSSN
jgi:hypothetical protein